MAKAPKTVAGVEIDPAAHYNVTIVKPCEAANCKFKPGSSAHIRGAVLLQLPADAVGAVAA